jgi:hypothetical protein
MADDTIRIEVSVALRSFPGSTVTDVAEIPAAEWAALGTRQRRERLDRIAAAARDREVTAWAKVEDAPPGEDGDTWPARPDRDLVGTADGL